MFTGIIEEVGRVISISSGSLTVSANKTLRGAEPGDSIAVNGVCLTITNLNQNSFTIGIMPETLRRTNLGQLKSGDEVNLERAMQLGGRLGGHLVQGHIDGTGKIISIQHEGGARVIRFETPPDIIRYVVEKGFIAIDGASLTVINCDAGSFTVSLIEHTQKNTTLGKWRVGSLVNFEVDIIAKYVERLSSIRNTEITADFLSRHGFTVS